jgi:lipid-A-disaccharide synthase
VPVTFVGHPLVETVRPDPDRDGFLQAHGLDPGQPLLAVLPGSRPQEVAHNLPPIAGALRRLAQERPRLQSALAAAPGLPVEPLRDALRGLPVHIVAGATHGLMGAADAGIVASGTATVEAALLGLPMVVVYRLSALTYALGRPLVRVPHYAMANLIAGREVVKELIQSEFRPDTVAAEVLRLLEDGGRRRSVLEGLAEIRTRLGGPGASARAAEVVSGMITEKD